MKKLQIKFQCPDGLEIFSKATIRTEETIAEAKNFVQQIVDSGFKDISVENSNITYIPHEVLKKCIITIVFYET